MGAGCGTSQAAKYALREDADVTSATGEVGAPAILPAGHRLGRYEVQRVLGMGGRGVGYQGRDVGLDRPGALKRLRRGGPPDRARHPPAHHDERGV